MLLKAVECCTHARQRLHLAFMFSGRSVPDSIWQALLGFVSLSDAYSLLVVSKSVNQALVSAALLRCMPEGEAGGRIVNLPEEEQRGFGALDALLLAIDPQKVSALTVCLVACDSAPRQIHLLNRIICRHARIQRLHLDVRPSPNAGRRKYDDDVLDALNALAEAIGTLETLSSYHLSTWPDHSRPVSDSRSIRTLRPPKFRFRSRKTPPSAAAPLVLRFQSTLPFAELAYPATLTLLESRPISELCLQMPPSATESALILGKISAALPTLPRLTLVGTDLYETQTIECLARFRTLEMLVIDGTVEEHMSPKTATSGNSALSKPKLRRILSSVIRPSLSLASLSTLSASPPDITALLELRVPLLRLSTIFIRLPLSEFPDVHTLSVLDGIACKLGTINSTGDTRPSLSLDVLCPGNSQRPICHSLDRALIQGADWTATYSRFHQFRVHDFNGPQHSPSSLSRWLCLFPELQRVDFAGELPLSRFRPRLTSSIRSGAPHVREIYFAQARWEGVALVGASGSETQFTDLPDDVLLCIFDHLQAELYALSRLSRRLHLLALPAFLAAHKIPDPSKDIVIELRNPHTGADLLSTLSSSLYLKNITSITCRWGSCSSMAWFIHDIQRLVAFLDRFPSVERVSLTLIDLYHLPATVVSDVTRTKCRDAVAALLRLVLGKLTGAAELNVRGPPMVIPSYGMDSPVWPASAQNILLPPSACPNALRAFSLTNRSLLAPAGLRWIFSALRQSPRLTSFAIGSPRDAAAAVLLIELVSETLPHLTELTIIHGGDKDISYTLLATLLGALPLLETVVLPRKAPVFSVKDLVPLLVHKHLTHLTAPPGVILHLAGVSHRERRNALPALRSLVLLLSQWFPLPAGWTVARILSAIVATRSSEQPPLEITLNVMVYSTRG
ncbi:Ribonuclease H-like protein [Mycena kentingensis (nom. inval.)]|nr:Ribonuclease H-like protein [Mycena kentingensis (nom. inval.)]